MTDIEFRSAVAVQVDRWFEETGGVQPPVAGTKRPDASSGTRSHSASGRLLIPYTNTARGANRGQ